MKNAILQRMTQGDEGSFGLLTAQGLESMRSLELPWRNNDKGKSCMPAGDYICVWHQSPSKGWVYMLTGTQPRSDVLIHSANWGGDIDKGWFTQLLGCIALGYAQGVLVPPGGKAQHALTRDSKGRGSKDACDAFYAWGAKESILLSIKDIAQTSA